MASPAADPDPVPVIACRGAVVRRGRGSGAFELRVPDFTLMPGEHVACIGPSGCGKTTLLHLVTGILPARPGTVRFENVDLGRASESQRRDVRRQRVGFVLQDLGLIEYLSAMDNMLLPGRLAGAPRGWTRGRAARADARALARDLGIEARLRRRPARLSQGERQRVAIGRALLSRPGLIAGDEPTGNLDPPRARASIELMLNRARAINAAVLVVTHDHGLLPAFDRVIDLGATSGAAGPATSVGPAAPMELERGS
ncbi:MAG: ABC transporter ATP-binding protein [Phycisphaerales bacterium]